MRAVARAVVQHPLLLAYYSVHTSSAALAQGEAEIKRIGQRLRAACRL